MLLLLVLSLAGLGFSVLIQLFLFGRKNSVISNACGLEENSSCHAVLTSSYSKVTKRVHVADIALIYFMLQFLFGLLSFFHSASQSFYIIQTIPCSLAFAASVYSLYVQKFKLHAWCRLCLGISLVIWAQQFFILYSFFANTGYSGADLLSGSFVENALPTFLDYFISFLIACSWFFLKPQLLLAKEVERNRKQLLRWKHNPNIFQAIWGMQKEINGETWADDFLVGNRTAPVKLMVAINPYCPACAREYKFLKPVILSNSKEVALIVRFLLIPEKKDRRWFASQYLLHTYDKAKNFREQLNILEEWFSQSLSLAAIKKNLKVPDESYRSEYFNRVKKWADASGIVHTPTLFFNGREFPAPYSVLDLKTLIPQMTTKSASAKS
jgi:uncharacterized membrane protein